MLNLYKFLSVKTPIWAILLGLIGTLCLVFIDLSVFTTWGDNNGSLMNGFWSISKLKAYHLSFWVVLVVLWILVFMSGRKG